MPEFLFAPAPHNEAIDFIKSKPVVPREIFDQLLPELQGRAFTISGLVPADIQRQVRDLVADLPAGMPWNTQKQLIVDQLAPYLTEEGARAKAELLLRINGQEAYATAAWRVMDAQRLVFPYWQYQTMGDSHVRPSHAALNGIVLPADSSFWFTHFPPWDWGCRCIVIPLSRAGMEHIRKQDAGKPPEQQRVLEGPLRRELELNNRLVRGMNEIVNVSPPDPKGASAFHYHPGDMQLSVDDLKARYDARTWDTFESWARKTEIPNENRSVWEWLNGEPGAPEIAKVEPPVAPAPAIGSRQSPVSGALTFKVRDATLRTELERVARVVDATHDDGGVPHLDVFAARANSRALGTLSIADRTIEVKATGDWPSLTFAHEVGHALDYFAIGPDRKFASEAAELFEEWRDAIDHSAAILRIRKEPGIPLRSYFTRYHEAFARSYAQFIATRSNDPTLLAQMQKILDSPFSYRQWQPDDFAPIADALETIFNKLGWMP